MIDNLYFFLIAVFAVAAVFGLMGIIAGAFDD